MKMEHELSAVGRRNYVKLIARKIAESGQVGPRELTKLYEVFALLETSETERLDLLETLVFKQRQLRNLPVPQEFLESDEVRVALGKDILFLGQDQKDSMARSAVTKLLNELSLSSDQIRVLSEWISLENDILRKMGAGEEWMAKCDMKELLARFASVGIPLTGLYGAGITGFSAVGITSGLATIGGYTGLATLGLNPMTAGIAGLIIAGVTVKNVADFAIGKSTLDKKAIQEQAEQLRIVQLKAATRLAADIPQFLRHGGIWAIFRRGRRKQMTDVMRNALQQLEGFSSDQA